MNKAFLGVALIGGLALGLTARAGCVDPRVGAQQGASALMSANLESSVKAFDSRNADGSIVGTWFVVYTPEGSTTPSGQAFIQWHSDGTEWENINYPVLGGNICMGSWIQIDQSHVSRNHYGWLYNNGLLAGYFNETETDELNGNTYVGVNDTKLYFYPVPPATEGTTMELKGTAKAERIAP
jgi:hypothetical protein